MISVKFLLYYIYSFLFRYIPTLGISYHAHVGWSCESSCHFVFLGSSISQLFVWIDTVKVGSTQHQRKHERRRNAKYNVQWYQSYKDWKTILRYNQSKLLELSCYIYEQITLCISNISIIAKIVYSFVSVNVPTEQQMPPWHDPWFHWARRPWPGRISFHGRSSSFEEVWLYKILI